MSDESGVRSAEGVLRHAADLIERNRFGLTVAEDVYDVFRAVREAEPDPQLRDEALDLLRTRTGSAYLYQWQELPGRTQAQVVTALRGNRRDRSASEGGGTA